MYENHNDSENHIEYTSTKLPNKNIRHHKGNTIKNEIRV